MIEVANRFAQTIPERIEKAMAAAPQPRAGGEPEVVVWHAPSRDGRGGMDRELILDLADQGVRVRDIAVLVRGRAAYPQLVEQFETFGIPVQPGGRTGLFDQPEAVVLGQTIAWLSDIEWREGFGPSSQTITETGLLAEYRERLPARSGRSATACAACFASGRRPSRCTDRTADLVGELYELLRRSECGTGT